MKISSKLVLMLVLAASFSYGGIAPCMAEGDLPLYTGAKEVKHQAREIAGRPFEFSYYTAPAAPAQIREFYVRKLTEAGWTTNDPLKQMEEANIQVLQVANVREMMRNNVVFQRGQETLVLNIFPVEFATDKLTRYTLAKGQINRDPAAMSATAAFIPKLLEKPKKDFAPVYPQASLIALTENDPLTQATYVAKAPLDQVILFYKGNMPGYGWILTKEEPAGDLPMTDGIKVLSDPTCPSCSQHVGDQQMPVKMSGMNMVFSNAKGEKCRVGIFNFKGINDIPDMGAHVTIVLNYDEKK